MAKDEVLPIDQDSRDHLDAVRQGRPRWFVMNCRGSQILSLVVYQKGTRDKYEKLAKKAGQGQLCFGLIEGRGPDLSFKLAISEGFDKEPVKATTLKAFLEEHADYKSQPTFALVQSITAPPDEGQPGSTATPAATAPTPSPAANDEKMRFMNRLKVLKPTIDEISEGTSNAAQKVQEKATEVGTLARGGEFAAANVALDRLEELLQEAGPATTSTDGVPVPPPPPPLPPQRKAVAGLRHLAPQVTQAMQAYPERQAELRQLKSAIEKLQSDDKFQDADLVVAKLEKLLATLGSVDPLKADEFHEQWDAAIDAWDTAVETVKQQLAGLQSYLTADADEELQAIGEFGLGAVTQKHLVPLSAALMELDSTGPEQLKTAAKRVQNLVKAFREHVQTSPMVKACDENPFGVAVAIRQTLTPGFDALERGLTTVTGP